MAKDFTVTISKDSPRAQDFMKAFGRLTVHIESFIPQWMSHPDFEDEQKMYKLDFEFVTEEEFERLVDVINEKFQAERGAVAASLKALGLPILAADCIVTIENPQRWFDVEITAGKEQFFDEDDDDYDYDAYENEWDDDYDWDDDIDEYDEDWDEEDEEDYVYQDPPTLLPPVLLDGEDEEEQ
jgi:hypothetical protein